MVMTAVFGVILVAGLAWVLNANLRVAPVEVNYAVPVAPQLAATGSGQTLYRIDASQSSVSYTIDETLAGATRTATGTTHGVAGDIVVDDGDPAASHLGEVVVNVEQLTSDQELRDNRIRNDFLQSSRYPEARFSPTSTDGLPSQITDGTPYDVTITGDLTVRDVTAPVTLDATVTRNADALDIDATTTVKLSTYGAGPISIIGLVTTGDDVQLAFDLVAPEADQVNIAEVASGETELATGPTDGPSFSQTVQPVLERNCASCHQTGAIGSQIWTLETAGDAAHVADGLGIVTQAGYMPPWPASDLGVELQHPMRLADEEIDAVVAWASAGGPLDVDPATEIVPDEPVVPEPRNDLELKLPVAYQASPEKPNDYRCFVLDPKITDPVAVTGYVFDPDVDEIVHHALIYRVTGERRQDALDRDAMDPGDGWECFGDIDVGRSLDPSGRGGGIGLVAGWAPGQQPAVYQEGTAMHLGEGDLFVVQMHYNTRRDGVPPDQSSIKLQLAEDSPDNYDEIVVNTYLAPAEIPCGPDEEGPLCDRDAALEELGRLYGPKGPVIANGLHMVCGTSPDELGVLDDENIARSSCDHNVYTEGTITSVLGHMHEIGQSFRMTLNPGTPEERILLDIPEWDFNWQLNYAPVEQIEIHKGDTIRVECSWDRDLRNRNLPAAYCTWAEGTEDEMCFSTMSVAKHTSNQGPPQTVPQNPPPG